MKCIVLCLSTLIAIVLALPAPQWPLGFGGGAFGVFQNGSSSGFNLSGAGNGTGPSLPDFGRFLPANLTFPPLGVPSLANFSGGSVPSFFPATGNPLGGGFPFFG
ncbi:AGAP006506-PA-like protein [Anopheles sinensis]|uniref:AGAP006506-PA-like protein n=1 Tax=Anopheles sinensis TaxID=74873 RepID=A0A084W6I4_ANOSI|nr:AGAP006506-PA-like protein [Anopheles sinensis]